MRKLFTLAVAFISFSLFGQNPQMLRDVAPGNNTGTIQQIVKTTGYTFFNENDGGAATDRSLFRTDGTGAGTIKLNLISPGYVSTKAEMLTPLGNKVVFAGDNFQNYGEIWASDGTQAGTVGIEHFLPINNKVPVVEIKTMGAYSYYSVINKDAGNVNRAYLRRTDGTAGGTSLVYDFSAFTGVPQVVFLTPVNNILYFIVYDAQGTGFDQLWRSDGTNAGTYMVYNFGAGYFVESYIMPAGNDMYILIGTFSAGIRTNTLWKSDGTAAGTGPLKVIGTNPVPGPVNNIYPPFVSIGNTLYFAGLDANGKELWQCDGTVAGTYMVADVFAGAGSSNPLSLTVLNNQVFFSANNGTSGGELWKYSAGVASMVKDINPGPTGSGPGGLTVSDNTIIFNANNGVNGGELWITDGTAANTVMVADINPGSANSIPNTFTPGNPVYFAATNGTNGFEVFKYDNNGDVLGGPRKFYVNDNSTTGDVFTQAVGNNANNGSKVYPFATLDYAISQVQTGDTIFMDAGTYNPSINFSISKSLTILGPNYNISPVDATRMAYNEDRNEEALINGVLITIAADNIAIKGLVFDPGAKIAISKSNNGLSFSNITIAKNGFIMTSNQGAINIFGNSASSSASTNYVIEDNAFVQEGTSIVQSVTLNALNGVTITHNSFLNDTGPFTQTAIHLGANSLVNNVTISDNIIDEPFTGMFSNFIGNITLDNNKIYNSFTATAVRDGSSTSGTITLKNNYYQINRSGNSLVVQLIGTSPAGTLKRVIVENNTIDINATGFPNSPTGYLYAQCNVGINAAEYVGRKNVINISGNLTGYNGLFWTMRCNGKFNSVNIDSNELYFNATNLPAASNAYGIVLNLNTGSGNVPPSGSSINITHNKVSGFGRAVQFIGGALPGVTCDIHNNSLINNRDLAIVNANHISPAMNATCNWYGFTNAQSVAAKIFSSTPGGVIYSPWLTNGTDNDPATGFQPVAGSCNGTPVVAVFDSKTDNVCNGASSGTINITISGGVLPYTIDWSKNNTPGYSSNEDLTNLGAGSYSVIITDAMGSTASLTNISITEPLLLEATASGSNVDCNGNNTGSASVNAGGGTAPYTYLWSNGATTSSISNLVAGNYSVTVTDANGCTKEASYEVTQPAILVATASGDNVDCNGNSTGSASVSVNGGTAPYTYLWSNGGTASSISNLIAANYSVTVTDANGCTAQSSYTVTEPAVLTATATGTSTTCANSATVNPVGGTAPYTYVWSNGATTQSITSIPAGTYSVTVTDANGCTVIANCTVTANEAFNPSASVSEVSCFGGNNGSITVTNVNATAPFEYSIDGIYFQPGNVFSGLTAGDYTITVRDANGCTGFVSKTVDQPPLLSAVVNTNQSTCFGQSSGSITVTVAGGSGAIGYSWTGPNGFTSTQKNISGLAAGNYVLTATDNNGCTTILNATVLSLNEIIVNAVIGNVVCKGETNGYIDLTVSGGTGSGFNYVWNGGTTTQDRTNLGNGNYSVTITDIGSGCSVNKSYTVSQATNLLKLSNPSFTNVKGCAPADLGTISASATGGMRPCLFKLSNGSYQVDSVFTGLAAGTYTVYVKDAYGCEKSAQVTITDDGTDPYEGTGGNRNNSKGKAFGIPLGTITARIATTPAYTDPLDWYQVTTNAQGNYTLSISHPSATFSISLFFSGNGGVVDSMPGSTSVNKQYSLSPSTDYFIRVTGGPSITCYQLTFNNTLVTRMSTGLITQENKTQVDKLNTSVFPNPHRGNFGIKIESAQDGVAIVEVMNNAGQLVAEKRQTVNKGGISIVNFTNMNHSMLIYRVRIGNESSTGKIIGPN